MNTESMKEKEKDIGDSAIRDLVINYGSDHELTAYLKRNMVRMEATIAYSRLAGHALTRSKWRRWTGWLTIPPCCLIPLQDLEHHEIFHTRSDSKMWTAPQAQDWRQVLNLLNLEEQ